MTFTLLAAALTLGCGDGKGGDGRTSAVPSSSSSESVSGIRAKVLQTDLTLDRTLDLRAADGRVPHRVDLTRVRAGGRRAVIGRGLPVARNGSRLVIRLSKAVAGRFSSCAPTAIVLRSSAGQQGKRWTAKRAVVPEPPACGRFFGPTSVWNTRLSSRTPLDPLTRVLSAKLRSLVAADLARNYGPGINTIQYSTPIYTVPRRQRRVSVVVDRQASWADALRRALAAGVPIPPRARAARGNDRHLVVWQPSRDTFWELWVAGKRAGRWHAQWGGVMRPVSRSRGFFYSGWGIQPGATASSLPLVGGLITPAELRRGRIDHALALALPSTRAGVWSLPATRTDGHFQGAGVIPEGARFRIDPRVKLTRLGLPRVTLLLARAAQHYGMIVRDTSATVTMYAQDPLGRPRLYPSLFGGLSSQKLLAAFPWRRVQLVKMALRTYNGPGVPAKYRGPAPVPLVAGRGSIPRSSDLYGLPHQK